ncbi:MAG: succinate dehydrogenase/fumarate reductase iron-sulfur subunit [Alphaproteobacteria bacterium]
MKPEQADNSETGGAISVRVWRGDAAGGDYEEFTIPDRPNQTILDAVTEIQRDHDPSLSYRFACRVGMCGSCAMMVNGKPRWTCRTLVETVAGPSRRLTLAPLRNLPVIKDLAADMTVFFEKWGKAMGRFDDGGAPDPDFAPVDPASKDRQDVDSAIECINCGVCYAACDTVTWDEDYLGPAALNRAWSLIKDEKDKGRVDRLRAVSRKGGCLSCHTHQRCADLCPNLLNPTRSIAGLKRAVMVSTLKGEL